VPVAAGFAGRAEQSQGRAASQNPQNKAGFRNRFTGMVPEKVRALFVQIFELIAIGTLSASTPSSSMEGLRRR